MTSYAIYNIGRSKSAGRLIFLRHPLSGFKGFNAARDFTDRMGEAGFFTEALAGMLVRFSRGGCKAVDTDLFNKLETRLIQAIELSNEANRDALGGLQ